MPALAGKAAVNTTSPLEEELLMVIVESDDPNPFAVIVPLIRIVDWDHGSTVTNPSTSETVREL